MLKYLLLTTDIYKIIVFSATSYPCEQNWKRTDTLPIHLSSHLDVYLNKMNYITKQYVFPNIWPIYTIKWISLFQV